MQNTPNVTNIKDFLNECKIDIQVLVTYKILIEIPFQSDQSPCGFQLLRLSNTLFVFRSSFV